MADVLSQIPGLAGYLAMEQQRRQGALQDFQGASGIMNVLRQQEEAQRQAQMAPLQMQALQAQVQQAQAAAQAAQQKREFFSPSNVQQFMTPGSPGFEAPSAELGGGPGKPATAPALDLERFVNAGAAAGVISPDVLLNRQNILEQRKADREQKMQELQLRLSEARTTAQERMAFQEQLARIQQEGRIDAIRMAALMRPAPQPRQDPLVQVEMDDPSKPGQKILRYVPQSKASGMSPPTKATADKPLTEYQGKAVLFGTRTAQADKILRDLEEKISVEGLAVKQAAQETPVFGGMLGAAGNALLSNNQQRVEQAQRDFVNAVLRQESGAVISEAEFANAKKQYFPQPGDNKAVIDQKRRNREIAINGFKRIAGPGSTDIDAILNEPLMPAAPTVDPKIKALVDKYGG